MEDPDRAWLRAVDLTSMDRRIGATEVNRLLSSGVRYVGAVEVDERGRLKATVEDARTGVAYARTDNVVLRVRGAELEISCSCSRGRSFLCRHASAVLVDLAASPALRDALLTRADPRPALATLPAERFAAFEERSLDDRLAAWLPASTFDTGFEIDVEVAASAGLASADPRPAIFLRHRRPPARGAIKPRDVIAARLPPRHRRLAELTAPSNAVRDALVATGAQASLLIHLLRDEPAIFTRRWKAPLRFSSVTATPRVDVDGERLVARFYDPAGARLFEAEHALLYAGPFPWVWSTTLHVFHPVDEAVDLDLLWGLMTVPSLPFKAENAGRIGRLLLERSRNLGVRLPEPEAFGLPPLETPVFELRVGGSPLAIEASLTARYGDARLTVSPSNQTRVTSGTRRWSARRSPCSLERGSRRTERSWSGAKTKPSSSGVAASPPSARGTWTKRHASISSSPRRSASRR